jgi:hypothetical protein
MAKLPSNIRFIFKADMYIDGDFRDSLELGILEMPVGLTITYDTSSDEAALAAIGENDATTDIPEAGDGDGRGRGAGNLFVDEDRGWERIVPADSGPLR